MIDSARLHAAGSFRIVIFLPYAVPAVVAVLMWGFIHSDKFGLTAGPNDLLGGAFRVSRAVERPALRGAAVITTIFSIMGSFRLFTEPVILKPLATRAPSPSRRAATGAAATHEDGHRG